MAVAIALATVTTLAACVPLPPSAAESLLGGPPLDEPEDESPYQSPSQESQPDTMEWTYASEAGCISVVDTLTPTEAVRAITSGAARQFDTRAAAEDWVDPDTDVTFGYRDLIVAGEIDGRTFVWEDLGFECSDHGAAKRASRNGTFVSMYWNVDASATLTFARHGRIAAETYDWMAPAAKDWKVLERHGATPVSEETWDEDPVRAGLVVQSEIMGLDAMADPSWRELPGVEFWGAGF